MTGGDIRRAGRERIAALAILAGLALLAAGALTSPLRTALAAREDARSRFDHYLAIASEPFEPTAAYDPALLAANYPDEPNAQLNLQSILDTHARSTAVAVQSLTPVGGEPLGEFGRIAWIEASIQGDLQAVLDFLAALDRERPVLLVRAAEFSVTNPADPDRFLHVRIEVGRVWRPTAQSG